MYSIIPTIVRTMSASYWFFVSISAYFTLWTNLFRDFLKKLSLWKFVSNIRLVHIKFCSFVRRRFLSEPNNFVRTKLLVLIKVYRTSKNIKSKINETYNSRKDITKFKLNESYNISKDIKKSKINETHNIVLFISLY